MPIGSPRASTVKASRVSGSVPTSTSWLPAGPETMVSRASASPCRTRPRRDVLEHVGRRQGELAHEREPIVEGDESRGFDGIAQDPVRVALGVGAGEQRDLTGVTPAVEVRPYRPRIGQQADGATRHRAPDRRCIGFEANGAMALGRSLDADDGVRQQQKTGLRRQRHVAGRRGPITVEHEQRSVDAAAGDPTIGRQQRRGRVDPVGQLPDAVIGCAPSPQGAVAAHREQRAVLAGGDLVDGRGERQHAQRRLLLARHRGGGWTRGGSQHGQQGAATVDATAKTCAIRCRCHAAIFVIGRRLGMRRRRDGVAHRKRRLCE